MTESGNLLPERIEEFLLGCVKTIHDTVGEKRIDSIVLAGSFGGGEGTYLEEDDGIKVLSDFDIYLIVKKQGDLLELSPVRSRIGRECERSAGDITLYGSVDIGVVTTRDLKHLPLNPGTYQLKYRSRVLYGSTEALDLIPDFPVDSIPEKEALFLLENRMASILGILVEKKLSMNRDEWLKATYDISRIYTDIAIAATIVGSQFVPGYAERLRFLQENVGKKTDINKLLDDRLLERIELATRIKFKPCTAFDEVMNLDEFTDEALEDIFYIWRRIYENIERKNVDLSGNMLGAEPLSRSKPLSNLRSWWVLSKSMGLSRGVKTILEYNLKCVRCSPFDLIRFSAVEMVFYYLKNGAEGRIVPRVAGFPYSDTSWRKAAGEVAAWWNRIVHGE